MERGIFLVADFIPGESVLCLMERVLDWDLSDLGNIPAFFSNSGPSYLITVLGFDFSICKIGKVIPALKVMMW